jgi:signal transduction histidine kinase
MARHAGRFAREANARRLPRRLEPFGLAAGQAMQKQHRGIRLGFWSSVAFALVLAVAAIATIHAVVSTLGQVAFEDATQLVDIQRLRSSLELRSMKTRRYLASGATGDVPEIRKLNVEIARDLKRIRAVMPEPQESAILERIEDANAGVERAIARTVVQRQAGQPLEELIQAYETGIQPHRHELESALVDLAELQEVQLRMAAIAARETIGFDLVLLIGLTITALMVCTFFGYQLMRALRALRVEHEESARHAARVEHVNRELDAFAGRVSHDLRNLLAPVRLAASMVRRSSSRPESLERLTGKIEVGIDRSVAMVDGLLAFSRSGRPDPGAAASVQTAVEEAVEQLAPLVGRVDAEIDLAIEDAEVACARELLNVVLLNLLGNALKYLESCPTRRVGIVTRRCGSSCLIVVDDTGPGIPGSLHEHVFQPFYRVPGTRAAGTGIGLATVKRIVDAHGGAIRIESDGRTGTAFHVSLPLASPAHGA